MDQLGSAVDKRESIPLTESDATTTTDDAQTPAE